MQTRSARREICIIPVYRYRSSLTAGGKDSFLKGIGWSGDIDHLQTFIPASHKDIVTTRWHMPGYFFHITKSCFNGQGGSGNIYHPHAIIPGRDAGIRTLDSNIFCISSRQIAFFLRQRRIGYINNLQTYRARSSANDIGIMTADSDVTCPITDRGHLHRRGGYGDINYSQAIIRIS